MFDLLRNRHGERLDATFTAGAAGRRDLVLVTHGVTSHKDRPWLEAVEQALVAEGLATLRFSFAGNGASEGRFADATLHKEVEDLGAVLDTAEGWRVAYVGHSMGGAVGLLRAARDRRIRALVSLAGMVHVSAFLERHFGHLTPGRDVMLGKDHCPLTQEFLDSAAAVDTVLPQAAALRIPWRIVHGTADDIVPHEDALDAVAVSGGRADLVTLPDVDHRFTGHHPALCQAVAPWLATTLDRLDQPGGP